MNHLPLSKPMQQKSPDAPAFSRPYIIDFKLTQAENGSRVFQLLSPVAARSPHLNAKLKSSPLGSEKRWEVELPGINADAFEIYVWWLYSDKVPFGVWASKEITEGKKIPEEKSLKWHDCAELVYTYVLNASFKDEKFRSYLIEELKKWLDPRQTPDMRILEYVVGAQQEQELHNFVIDHMLLDKEQIRHVLMHLVRKASLSGLVGTIAPVRKEAEVADSLDTTSNHDLARSDEYVLETQCSDFWSPVPAREILGLPRASIGTPLAHEAQVLSMPDVSQFGGMHLEGDVHTLRLDGAAARPGSAGQILTQNLREPRSASAQSVHEDHTLIPSSVPGISQREKPLPQTPHTSTRSSVSALSITRKPVGSATASEVKRKPVGIQNPVELVGSATTELGGTEVTQADLKIREQGASKEEKQRAASFHVVLPK